MAKSRGPLLTGAGLGEMSAGDTNEAEGECATFRGGIRRCLLLKNNRAAGFD